MTAVVLRTVIKETHCMLYIFIHSYYNFLSLSGFTQVSALSSSSKGIIILKWKWPH
jgi:hypothetical protein